MTIFRMMNWQRLHGFCLFLSFLFLSLFPSGCGDNEEACLSDGSHETASASLTINWHDTTAAQDATPIRAAVLDCQAAGVAQVVCEVYDAAGNLLATGGPWPCEDGSGRVESIPVGQNRIFVALAEDDLGNILYHGETTGVIIQAGQITPGVVIDAYLFVPTLSAPENDAQDVDPSDVSLEWEPVENADEYLVQVATDVDFENIVISETTPATVYAPPTLEPSTEYFWKICAVDMQTNTGADSEIRSFVTSDCALTIVPTEQTIDAEGGTFDVAITATNDQCEWTASENVDWITLSSDSGTGNGSVTVTVLANTGAEPRAATITIANQSLTVNQYPPDYPGVLRFSSATYSVDEDGGSVLITVTRTGGSNGAVAVGYATSNGTATAGSDYTSRSGTLSWADEDSANKTFSIPIINDSTYEGNETVNVTLRSVTGGATIGSPDTATLTIIDDESPQPGVLSLSSATYSVDEDGGSASITVTRTGGSDGAVSVGYTTSNGTATAGSDYTSRSGTLSWTDGDSANKTFSVPIINDSIYEGNETVSLTLSSATGGATIGSPGTATMTIVDDDPPPQPGVLRFSSATYSVDENGGSASITVTRTGGSDGAVSVGYATSNGTATAGSDYRSTSGTLSWADGDGASKTFSVPIINDSGDEPDETVILTLSSATGGATIGSPGTATLTIIDDDLPPQPGVLRFSSATYSVDENGGSVSITVTRTGGSDGAVGVGYATSNGTATAGSDYRSTSGTLSWADGDDASKTFSVPIINDSGDEPDETVILTLSSATGGATIGSPGTATMTIIDDDPPPQPGVLRFSSATYSVDEDGGSVSITVTRTGGSDGAVSVRYATSNGTATAGSDYRSASGTLSWTNGDNANKTFSVPIIDDSVDENDETVTLTLSSVTGGATIGSPGTATMTIRDDDDHRIWNIDMAPSSPASLEFDERVNITFNYHTDEAGGVRLFCIPYTNGSWTPNLADNPSPIYPAGDGTGDGFITVTSGSVTVDQIRVYMTNADQSQTLFDTYIDVSYTFGPSIDITGNWSLEYDWECDGNPVSTSWYIAIGGTFTDGEGNGGTWSTSGSQVTITYSNNTTYTGTVSGNNMSGTMVSNTSTGCWSATRSIVIYSFEATPNNGESSVGADGTLLAP